MRLFLVLLCWLASASSAFAQSVPVPVISARAWALLDYGSGQVLTSGNIDTPLEPASLTKVMTAYLAYTALKEKTLTPDQAIPVSERAWRMPGSRTFVEVNRKVRVDDLQRAHRHNTWI